MCDFSYTVTDKGIDISSLVKEVGFSVNILVYISPRLWEQHLDMGDRYEYFRLLLILREYIEVAFDTDDEISLFDVEPDSDFYLFETLHLKAVIKKEELYISLEFEDLYKLFEEAGLI